MDQFFASLPRPVLAIGAILIGFIVIVASNPPETICDGQLEIFREAQKSALYEKPPVNGVQKPPLIKRLHDECLAGNGPGACFEYFDHLKKLVVDLRNLPHQCSEDAASEPQIVNNLASGLTLMAKIAWGDRGPASYGQRYGWFDASDLSLFCDMRQSMSRLLGPESFNDLRGRLLTSLPGAEKLPQEQLLQKSLFSVGCDSFR